MNQMTFSDMEYSGRKRVTQKERFLREMNSGVYCGSGYVHTITGTSANVHDLEEALKLIRKDDDVVYGDSGYLGLSERPEIKDDKKPFTD